MGHRLRPGRNRFRPSCLELGLCACGRGSFATAGLTRGRGAEVLNVFKISKVGQIAGCRVTDGLIRRDYQVRVLREGAELWKGKIASLKRFKDDVSEVRQGVECGIDLAGFKEIQIGDTIEAFTTERLAAELGQNAAAARKAEKEREAAAATAEHSVNA